MQRDDFASGGWQKLIETLGRRRSPARGANSRPNAQWVGAQLIEDLLEACVVFAMGLMFVIAFRWKK